MGEDGRSAAVRRKHVICVNIDKVRQAALVTKKCCSSVAPEDGKIRFPCERCGGNHSIKQREFPLARGIFRGPLLVARNCHGRDGSWRIRFDTPVCKIFYPRCRNLTSIALLLELAIQNREITLVSLK
jgi:ribosomal protein S14